MATISKALGDGSAGHVIECLINGQPRAFKIRFLLGEFKSAAENALSSAAARATAQIAKTMADVGLLTSVERDSLMREHVKDTVGGRYAFGGPEFNETLGGFFNGEDAAKAMLKNGLTPVLTALMCSMVGCTTDELLQIMFQKGAEFSEKFAIAMQESMPTPKPEPGTVA